QMYWAILHAARFPADEARMRQLGLAAPQAKHFDPHFKKQLREAVHGTPPSPPGSLDELRAELLAVAKFRREQPDHPALKSGSKPLANHFVQLYFEEAHNLFPVDDKDLTGVYARFAKEGAKFHIGMVYSTQSPSTINRELLAQTENFFVGHLSSQHEAQALGRLQVAFAGHEPDILRTRTPGYMR